VKDLLVITPTRGRPWHLQRLAVALADTCALGTDLAFYVDDDDPRLREYRELGLPGFLTGPRDTLTALTNRIALERAGEYRFLASLGDDHVPRTPGWDRELCGEIERMGGTGFAWGDGSRWVIPEAIVMSSNIVDEEKGLGWMALPRCGHYKIDDAWLMLSCATGLGRYRHDVMVEHMQFGIPYNPLDPNSGMKALKDQTYADALQPEKMSADVVGYLEWLADPDDGLASDTTKIRALAGLP
jgi:hypothetical protein